MDNVQCQGQVLIECSEKLIERALGAALTVHRSLGPGLLESAYEQALIAELSYLGISMRHQVEVPVWYRGRKLGTGFRADIVVEDRLLLELKCVDALAPIHIAQLVTYLRPLNMKRGYLLNFNTRLMRDGIKRVSI